MNISNWSIDKYNFTEEEIKLTLGSYVPKTIMANEFFLKEGEICNYIGYVTKGLLRSYFYDDQANEITTNFFPEGTLIIAMDSFNNGYHRKSILKQLKTQNLVLSAISDKWNFIS